MSKDKYDHLEVGDFIKITYKDTYPDPAVVTGFRQGKNIMYVRIAGDSHDTVLGGYSGIHYKKIIFIGRGEMPKVLYT